MPLRPRGRRAGHAAGHETRGRRSHLLGAMTNRLSPLPRLAVLALLALAGCAAPTIEQLYVPLSGGAGYGYTEYMLPDRQAVVTYDAPIDTAFSYEGPGGQQAIDATLGKAYDLALLRSSDIALASGFAAFRVTNRTNDVNVRQFYEPSYYGYPYFRRFGHPFYDPFGFPPYDGYQVLYTRVTLNVTFEGRVEKGTFDAAEVRTTIRARYAPRVGQ
jgi:hypothetical protein